MHKRGPQLGAEGNKRDIISPKGERKTDEQGSTVPVPSPSPRTEKAPIPTPNAVDMHRAKERAYQAISPQDTDGYRQVLPTQESRYSVLSNETRYYTKASPNEYLAERRAEMIDGHYPPMRDLLATYESFHLPNVDRDAALQRMDQTVHEIAAIRDKKGEMKMAKELLKRVYGPRYSSGKNSMLGLFDKNKERGNCQATAKSIVTIAEQLGYDPDTDIAYQRFSDHDRALLRMDGEWYVMEGKKPTKVRDTEGTVISSLTDEKRIIAGLQPRRDIQPGNEVYHKENGKLHDNNLIKWFRDGLRKLDRKVGVFKKTPVPTIQHEIAPTRAAGELTQITSLVASYFPFTEKQLKVAAGVLGALMLTYSAEKFQRKEVSNLSDLATEIHNDTEATKEIAKEITAEIADFATKALKDFSDSVSLKPIDRHQKPESITGIEGVSERQMTAIEKEAEKWYGLVNWRFGNLDRKDSKFITGEDFDVLEINTGEKVEKICPSLLRSFLGLAFGEGDGLPSRLVIRINGEHITNETIDSLKFLLNNEETTNGMNLVEEMRSRAIAKDRDGSLNGTYFRIEVNGEKVLLLGEGAGFGEDGRPYFRVPGQGEEQENLPQTILEIFRNGLLEHEEKPAEDFIQKNPDGTVEPIDTLSPDKISEKKRVPMSASGMMEDSHKSPEREDRNISNDAQERGRALAARTAIEDHLLSSNAYTMITDKQRAIFRSMIEEEADLYAQERSYLSLEEIEEKLEKRLAEMIEE
ncbi:MAG: hypothetical protein O2877_00290 [bacterium]|nr:hypothetical protein [bacterium]